MSGDVTPTTALSPAAAPAPTTPLSTAPPVPIDLPHDTRQANIIICSAVCLGIATVFVALRLYTRAYIIRAFGASDWSILMALLLSIATTGSLIEQATLGSGRHVWDLDPTDVSSGMRWGRSAWMGVLFYLLSLCFSKIAILLLYIHIFAFKWARTAGQILLGIVIISNVWMLIITCTACIPLNSFWDWTVEKKYCHPQSMWWSNTGLHMVTDFLIFLIPMPVVWSITLPKKQKLMLFGVFGLGFIVCFISILRLLQLIQTQYNPEIQNPDFTYQATELSYLTAVEINGAIVVACVMTLKPFIARHFPSLIISGRRSSGSSSSSSFSSTPGGGGRGGGRRGSENPMRRPPTIGSRPSKLPMSPVTIDSEIMVTTTTSKSRGSLQLAAAAAAQVWNRATTHSRTSTDGREGHGGSGNRENRNSMGYMELDDSWVVDVELAEGVGRKSGNNRPGQTQTGGNEMDSESGRQNGPGLGIGTAAGGVEKKNSTRSNDSDGTTLRPTSDEDTDTDYGVKPAAPLSFSSPIWSTHAPHAPMKSGQGTTGHGIEPPPAARISEKGH